MAIEFSRESYEHLPDCSGTRSRRFLKVLEGKFIDTGLSGAQKQMERVVTEMRDLLSSRRS